MAQWHLPHDKPAPVVADEDRLFDSQMIEQSHQIGREILDVVGFHRLRTIRRAVAALIGCNDMNPRLTQRLDLVTPRKRNLGPAVAQHHRRLVRFGTGLIEAHAYAIDLGILKRRHFNHCRRHESACSACAVVGRCIGRSEQFKLLRQHVGQFFHMRNDVCSRDETEIELIAIALHGDVQS